MLFPAMLSAGCTALSQRSRDHIARDRLPAMFMADEVPAFWHQRLEEAACHQRIQDQLGTLMSR